MKERPPWILPIIVLAQFAGGSPWFSGNAVLASLQVEWGLGTDVLGYLTSAVQLGFIAGTLCFAYFAVSDRHSPRVVFFACSLLGALANLCVYLVADGFYALLVFRFLTGFFLAGIYPVGMKIAAAWFPFDLGRALGFLIGALVAGTALPHLIKAMGGSLQWESVIIATSGLSAMGGLLLLLLVPNGPFMKKGASLNGEALGIIARNEGVRSAALGYFGHMWELYAFWAFIPVVLGAWLAAHPDASLDVSLWTFIIMASGSLGCIIGGYISRKTGSALVAGCCLTASGLCCLLSPALVSMPLWVCLAFFVFWGVVVVADSPQFSSVVANTAPPHLVGSVLTAVNCIGFFITIISIQLLNALMSVVPADRLYLVLALGPLVGLIGMRSVIRDRL